MPSPIQTGTRIGKHSLEQELRSLVMQGRVDRAYADGLLPSSFPSRAGALGTSAAPVADGRAT
jgi:hypothetical protein